MSIILHHLEKSNCLNPYKIFCFDLYVYSCLHNKAKLTCPKFKAAGLGEMSMH